MTDEPRAKGECSCCGGGIPSCPACSPTPEPPAPREAAERVYLDYYGDRPRKSEVKLYLIERGIQEGRRQERERCLALVREYSANMGLHPDRDREDKERG